MTRAKSFPLVCCALLLWLACQADRRAVTGRYEAARADAGCGRSRQVVLVLHEGGKGSWSMGDEYAEFRWETAAGGQIRIHTRTGGLISGALTEQEPPGIELSLPGCPDLHFSKAPL